MGITVAVTTAGSAPRPKRNHPRPSLGVATGSLGADGAEVAEALAVRAEQAVFLVAKILAGAEGPDHRLGPGQVRPGHHREEVVFDLVVEPAEHEGGERAPGDVPGRDHLPPSETQRVLSSEDGHAL